MKRYHVDTPTNLEAVRRALDQANGLRDTAGNPTPRQCRIFRNGVDVTGTEFDPATHGHPVMVHNVIAPATVAEDDTAALELPLVPEVEAHLGKTIRGVVIPADSACIRCERPREHAKLPPGVMLELDAKAVAGRSDADAVAELGPERATAARARANEAAKPADVDQLPVESETRH